MLRFLGIDSGGRPGGIDVQVGADAVSWDFSPIAPSELLRPIDELFSLRSWIACRSNTSSIYALSGPDSSRSLELTEKSANCDMVPGSDRFWFSNFDRLRWDEARNALSVTCVDGTGTTWFQAWLPGDRMLGAIGDKLVIAGGTKTHRWTRIIEPQAVTSSGFRGRSGPYINGIRIEASQLGDRFAYYDNMKNPAVYLVESSENFVMTFPGGRSHMGDWYVHPPHFRPFSNEFGLPIRLSPTEGRVLIADERATPIAESPTFSLDPYSFFVFFSWSADGQYVVLQDPFRKNQAFIYDVSGHRIMDLGRKREIVLTRRA